MPHHENHLYNFDSLKPHFYIVKLGVTGPYIIFLFLFKNIDCVYSLEPPQCFEQKCEKCQNFYLKTFNFCGEIIYLNRRVFVIL